MASTSSSTSSKKTAKSASTITQVSTLTTETKLPAHRDVIFIIVDLNPVWWGLEKISINSIHYLESILAFCNAHLVVSSLNQVSLIGVTPQGATFLYPPPPHFKLPTSGASGDSSFSQSGKYELLETMNETVRHLAKSAISRCPASLRTDINISGAVTKALCLYSRWNRDAEYLTGRLAARILIIKAADDNPSQYMSLMNAVFTAQKFQIPIDACILSTDHTASTNNGHAIHPPAAPTPPTSGLLQQAADLTGGIYLRIPQPSALLEYLLSIFLPRVDLRPALMLPSHRRFAGGSLRRTGVDFRATCFCHRKLVDIGYVCSVCLSIFCAFSPLCSTCHTQFKLQPLSTTPNKMAKTQ